MSVQIIRLMSAGSSVSVGPYDMPFYESGPTSHSFVWDGEGTIYFSRVSNSVAKVNTGSGLGVLNAGNGMTISWIGRCGTYDVTNLWKNNSGASKYVDFTRYARSGETLVRQDAFLIIVKDAFFCPVNLDIR